MATTRAPTQWTLTKQETITSFEAWRQNLQYCLSLDINFAPFLVYGFTWTRKTPTTPLRGMVGDGEERESLEDLTHSLGLDNSVMFLGMQPWRRAMQIRLLSDVSLCLMAGNSLVEAAVATTPLIAYDVDWHYELVKNTDTGFLLPEVDNEGAAEAVIRLLDDPELAKKLWQNARKLAIERHSIEKVRQIKIDFYEELM